MVVSFREKARRELSKFKAPVFPMPSAFVINCQMHLVVGAAQPHRLIADELILKAPTTSFTP
jgi:hypothetical protein